MQEKQRGFQEQNQLRGVVSRPGFDPMNPTHAAEAYAVAPTLAPKYLEQVLTTRESRGKITAADIKAKADKSNYNNHVFDKQQLTDLQIARLEKKREEWKAIFNERYDDIMKMLVEYEKSPADGIKIQLKFYEEVRAKWKLKYKNNDRFERQFMAYAKGESNIRW